MEKPMPQKNETPPGEAGLAKTSLLAGFDNHDLAPNPEKKQGPREAKERLLAIKRESLWNIGSTADAHLRLMLGSLEINDDEAAFHHARHAVENARAVARLVKDLRESREAR
jgi:hypothetical protein